MSAKELRQDPNKTQISPWKLSIFYLLSKSFIYKKYFSENQHTQYKFNSKSI